MNSTPGGEVERLRNDVKLPVNIDTPRDKGEGHAEAEGVTNVAAGKRGKKSDERMHQFKTFLWNPEKKEFMGRTSKSWSLILLFYVCLYSLLAGMFSLCIYGMLSTLSPYTPTYRDRVNNPGMMIRPYLGGVSIRFKPTVEATWSQYVQNLQDFLAPYNDSIQAMKNIPCSPGEYFMQDGDESEERLACQFNRATLKNCSGIEDPTFGYSIGKPCILLKMNKIIGYLPGLGTTPYVTCEILKVESNATFHFYPENGAFDLMYYPYYGKLTHVNYSTPLVAVQYENMESHLKVNIQCKIHGPGIKNDIFQDKYSGRVSFNLNIDE